MLLFDVGVRNALLGIHRRPLAPDQVGGVFEQWVILQIVYLNQALRKAWTLSSYRSEGGAEVDLVVHTRDEAIGIEIKAGRSVAKADGRGLAFLADLVRRTKTFRRWIVYRGDISSHPEPGRATKTTLTLFEESSAIAIHSTFRSTAKP